MKFEDFYNTVKETAQYGEHNRIVYPALGLAGETGEAVDIVKKALRYHEEGSPLTLTREKDRTLDMKYELGDILWYWCNLCIDLGYDPEEILYMNYTKLRERYSV